MEGASSLDDLDPLQLGGGAVYQGERSIFSAASPVVPPRLMALTHETFDQAAREHVKAKPHIPSSGGIYDQYNSSKTRLRPKSLGSPAKAHAFAVTETLEVPPSKPLQGNKDKSLSVHFQQGWTLSKVNYMTS